MSLFQQRWFRAASGEVVPFKIECDELTVADWHWAAVYIAQRVPFGEVEGVKTGGEKLAEQLRPFAIKGCKDLLIVDDVYTTGGSIERQRASREAKGFVLFARTPQLLPWVRAVWVLQP